MSNWEVSLVMRTAAATRSCSGILPSEAVAQRCSVKKVFLEISQNSQENTCARASVLVKLHAYAYWKRDSGTGVFLWILQNF